MSWTTWTKPSQENGFPASLPRWYSNSWPKKYDDQTAVLSVTCSLHKAQKDLQSRRILRHSEAKSKRESNKATSPSSEWVWPEQAESLQPQCYFFGNPSLQFWNHCFWRHISYHVWTASRKPPAHHFSHPDLEAFTSPEFRTGGGTLHSKGGKVQQYVGNNPLAIRNQDTKTSEPSSRWRRTLGNADNMSSL